MTSPGFVLARTLEGHSKSVSAVRFSPDGSRVASASADKTVRVWSVADGTQLCVLVGHERGCSDVAWTSDGRYLASASDDKNLHLWDVDPSSPHYARTVRVFAGHTSHVFCCDVNSRCGADNILASGSVDETVRLWDVRHGVCLNVLPAHSDPVTGVKFSPDGTVLLTCSYDGMIRAWAVATGACLKTVVLGSSGVHKGGIGNGSSGDEDENLAHSCDPRLCRQRGRRRSRSGGWRRDQRRRGVGRRREPQRAGGCHRDVYERPVPPRVHAGRHGEAVGLASGPGGSDLPGREEANGTVRSRRSRSAAGRRTRCAGQRMAR